MIFSLTALTCADPFTFSSSFSLQSKSEGSALPHSLLKENPSEINALIYIHRYPLLLLPIYIEENQKKEEEEEDEEEEDEEKEEEEEEES
jgi:hypothetical protein